MQKLSKNKFQNPLYDITDLKLAYLAGFIDGDGCINGQIIKSNDYKRKFKLQVSVVIFQKTSRRWFIDDLHKTIEMGYVRERDGMLELAIRAQKDVELILTKLMPYLIMKKPQAELVLKILNLLKNVKSDHEFLEVCKLIDKFAILNDSKKRINTSEIVKNVLFPPVET